MNIKGILVISRNIHFSKIMRKAKVEAASSKDKRVTRNKTTVEEKISVDLSTFKKKVKPKLSKHTAFEVIETLETAQDIENIEVKQEHAEEVAIKQEIEYKIGPQKRKHIKIEYDIKNEETKKNRNIPCNWEQVLDNVREMRKDADAPVDSMGCNKCHDDDALPKVIFMIYDKKL